jgi:hypothetical protein
MTVEQETLGAMMRDRARCIRSDLAQLLREADEKRTCLRSNANDILELAEKLVAVEDSLAE